MSMGKILDRLHVYLPIVIKVTSVDHQNYMVLASDVPKQVISLREYNILTQTGESISRGASYLLWVLILVSIFAGFVLDMLWGAF